MLVSLLIYAINLTNKLRRFIKVIGWRKTIERNILENKVNFGINWHNWMAIWAKYWIIC